MQTNHGVFLYRWMSKFDQESLAMLTEHTKRYRTQPLWPENWELNHPVALYIVCNLLHLTRHTSWWTDKKKIPPKMDNQSLGQSRLNSMEDSTRITASEYNLLDHTWYLFIWLIFTEPSRWIHINISIFLFVFLSACMYFFVILLGHILGYIWIYY